MSYRRTDPRQTWKPWLPKRDLGADTRLLAGLPIAALVLLGLGGSLKNGVVVSLGVSALALTGAYAGFLLIRSSIREVRRVRQIDLRRNPDVDASAVWLSGCFLTFIGAMMILGATAVISGLVVQAK